MKGPLVASGVAVVLAVMAVYRLVNPIPAGERFIARATIKQIASSVVIPRGMRAVAVPVNGVVGVRRLVFPGMRADVLVSGTLPSGTGGRESIPGPCSRISRCCPPAKTSRGTLKGSR